MFGNDQVLIVSVPLAGSGTDTWSGRAYRTERTSGVYQSYGETASETVSEPPRPTNGWSRTRATAESRSSARSTE
jgi:hypothetical protein